MRSLPHALREDVAVATRTKIIECLQQGKAFTSATCFREQCFHTCRILREYKARRNETKHAERPPALSLQELDEIIADILRGFRQRCSLTLREIASIV
jgi:hypothetical protein